MRLQVVLTTAESKKLLAKAVIKRSEFMRAFEQNICIVHPSSTTVFVLRELGVPLPSGVWVCGLTQPNGFCASGQVLEEDRQRLTAFDPKQYRYDWVFDRGQLSHDGTLSEWLSKMDANSVYVKTANSIDPDGKVGILFAAVGGGTIGLVIRARKEKNFPILIPTGLEKLIPARISECSKAATLWDITRATGTPCGVMPLDGEVMTEVDAFAQLTGVEALPIAAGGLAGAEGSIALVLRGEREALMRADKLIDEIKGARVPALYLLECASCVRKKCHNSIPGRERISKRWEIAEEKTSEQAVEQVGLVR